jgi:hypothetical protein
MGKSRQSDSKSFKPRNAPYKRTKKNLNNFKNISVSKNVKDQELYENEYDEYLMDDEENLDNDKL